MAGESDSSTGGFVSCIGLTCTFDGSGSADPEGSSLTYAWDFGDGTLGSGQKLSHTYGHVGSYTVSLTVTDNAGATGSDSKAINPMSLSARSYKLNGLQKVDLSWSGPSGKSFDLYRSGLKIATVQATAYTDNINKRGRELHVPGVRGRRHDLFERGDGQLLMLGSREVTGKRGDGPVPGGRSPPHAKRATEGICLRQACGTYSDLHRALQRGSASSGASPSGADR